MSSAEPGTGATSPTTATEDRQQALLEDLTTRLGDDVVGSHVRFGDLWVRVRPEAWVRAAEECRAMGFDYFCFLSGIDWMPHTADLDDDSPRVQTWTGVYAGADWCERETWEMYGFVFDGHPNLTHLYLPGEFEGFPLRKDFPLLAREVKPWPGLVDVEPFPEGTEEG